MASKIEWTDETWNPVVGCSVVSPGCTNCYAMRMAGTRLRGTAVYKDLTENSKAGPVWNGQLRLNERALALPLRWKKPRRIFVNSMGDLFHEDMQGDWISKILAMMARTPWHTYQILTKRPDSARRYLNAHNIDAVNHYANALGDRSGRDKVNAWPLPNVWLGVSVEDQRRADERVPLLLDTPAAVRFLSCEPLLGPVDLTSSPAGNGAHGRNLLTGRAFLIDGASDTVPAPRGLPGLDWIIVGGESGPGARPMHPDWARDIRDQCVAGGVPFFFKQWGEFVPDDRMRVGAKRAYFWPAADDGTFPTEISYQVGKKAAGRLLDGREWSQHPVSV